MCWVGKINASTGIKIIWHIHNAVCHHRLFWDLHMTEHMSHTYTYPPPSLLLCPEFSTSEDKITLHHGDAYITATAIHVDTQKTNNNTRIQRSDAKSQLFINILNRYHTKWPQCTSLVLTGTYMHAFYVSTTIVYPQTSTWATIINTMYGILS